MSTYVMLYSLCFYEQVADYFNAQESAKAARVSRYIVVVTTNEHLYCSIMLDAVFAHQNLLFWSDCVKQPT